MPMSAQKLHPRHFALSGHLSQRTDDDPYHYQFGFGNHHSTEAIPGALPQHGTNLPQKCPYDLYAEHLNSSPFVSSRDNTSNVWMYRIKPAVAHRPPRALGTRPHLESYFNPTNTDVVYTPLGYTWGPLPIPSKSADDQPRADTGVTFVDGLRALAGHGDPTTEGVAICQYAFNADMRRIAFVNYDGDLLLVPQRGALDCQTELGHLRVRPGAIAMMPAGLRFSIRVAPPTGAESTSFNDGCSGYALEVFGSRFTLPELGPLGANAMAHERDFAYPVASFDIDDDAGAVKPVEWKIQIKLAGKLHTYDQYHTPYDVVAWHGALAPWRYDLEEFGQLSANVDQLDPTSSTVVTALSSSLSRRSLVDFCAFGEKAAVALNSFRPPYHHRNVASELVGVVKGSYKGSVRPLEPGGLSFEQAFSPHGESYECWRTERQRALGMERVAVGYLGFLVHVPRQVAVTRWAIENHPDTRLEREDFWIGLKSHFLDNVDNINQKLASAGTTLFGTDESPLG